MKPAIKRSLRLFVGVTFILALGLYGLVVAYTPLTTMQAASTGVVLFGGWAGLAFAGTRALAGVFDRSPKVRRSPAQRSTYRARSAFSGR
jgi:hypothetical protein